MKWKKTPARKHCKCEKVQECKQQQGKWAIFHALRKWTKYETRVPKGNNVSMKKWKNVISNKESKQYCKLEEGELKNETRFLKGNRVSSEQVSYRMKQDYWKETQ